MSLANFHRQRLARSMHAGKLERRNPLPAGKYWIDVFQPGRQDWDYWLLYATGHVTVIKEEHYAGDYSEDAPGEGYPPRDWILFQTDAPLTWDIELAKKIGWPNTAGKEITTSNDTVQKPTAEDTLPWWQGGNQGLPAVKFALVGGGVIVAAVLGAYVLRSVR